MYLEKPRFIDSTFNLQKTVIPEPANTAQLIAELSRQRLIFDFHPAFRECLPGYLSYQVPLFPERTLVINLVPLPNSPLPFLRLPNPAHNRRNNGNGNKPTPQLQLIPAAKLGRHTSHSHLLYDAGHHQLLPCYPGQTTRLSFPPYHPETPPLAAILDLLDPNTDDNPHSYSMAWLLIHPSHRLAQPL